MKASIDIGTNTVLLLVGEYRDGQLFVIHEEQRTPRLGEGVDKAQQVFSEAMQRVINVLKEYQELIEAHYSEVSDIIVTATSAVRDAQNRARFLQKVNEQTGLNILILSGREEAKYTFRGAKSVLGAHHVSPASVVIDIGGGSTEIALGAGNHITDRYSFDMGCVRFTERYLSDDPLSKLQVKACKKAIAEMLDEYHFSIENKRTLIGVAGTVTSLAYIDGGLKEYKSEKINGYIVSIDKLKEYIQSFSGITAAELANRYPKVMRERADIFRAGLLILEGFMERYHFKDVLASTGGIRHGVVLNQYMSNQKSPE